MIHYMTGKGIVTCKVVSNLHLVEGQEGFEYVYWLDRDKVTCPECLRKIGKLLLLQQSKLMTDRQ